MKKYLFLILFLPFIGFAANLNLTEASTSNSDLSFTDSETEVADLSYACNPPEIFDETIFGPDILCLNDDGTFIFLFDYEHGGVINVDWQSSSNVSIMSSDNGHAEVLATGNGAASITVTLTITNGCGSTSVTVQHDFWIGTPEINGGVFGPDFLCENDIASFIVLFNMQNGTSNLNVSWSSSSNVSITNSDNGHADIVATGSGNASVTATVSLTNSCGTTTVTFQKDFWIGSPEINGGVFGPDFLCENDISSFIVLFNMQAGATNLNVSWSSSSNVTITNSDNGHADIVATGSGNASITATVSLTNSCGTSTVTFQKDFWIGAPEIVGGVFGPDVICENDVAAYIVLFSLPAGTSNLNVSWASSSNVTITNSDNGHVDIIATGSGDAFVTATVSLTNSCGTSTVTFQKDFWIGAPEIDAVVHGPSVLCDYTNSSYILLFTQPAGTTNLTVSWSTTPNMTITYSDNGHAEVYTNGSGVAYVIATVSLTNSCGTTTVTVKKKLFITECEEKSNSGSSGLLDENGDKRNTEISVYPNPTNGVVNVNLGSDFIVENENNLIEVIDAQGKKVFETSTQKGSAALDLTDLNRGVYLIRVTNSEQTQTKRVVIED